MSEKLAIHGGISSLPHRVEYGRQYIDEKDIDAVVNVLKSDFLTCGPEIERAEQKLCEITDAEHAVLISNGTAALHAACFAAGIQEGDEVITTPITFAASANCAVYCGATPVFADIDPETFNIDPKEIEKKITEKTKAVVAVDYTGQAVELDVIKEICERHNLVLIEDAAHSIGTNYKGKPVGSIADITTFSFHPVKTVTSGEGGAVLTNKEEYYKRTVLFRAHGITRNPEWMENQPEGGWYYEQVSFGMNYRMTDIQAALLSSQLDKLSNFKKRRTEIVEVYNRELAKIPGVIIQKEIADSDTARHLYILRMDMQEFSVTRREIYDALQAEGVGCNVHYIPVYYMPFYSTRGYQKGLCPNAEALYESMVSLPLHCCMTDEDVEDVIKAVKKICQGYKVSV